MRSYNEILSDMKNAFFEKTGENVEQYSDLGARFEAVASELFSLACRSDFVCRQAFPQTASGAYLDHHAALRSLQRKTAAKAHGTLTFSLAEAAVSDTPVPQGTVCSVEGQPFLQFQTTQAAVIPAGETSVDVPAEALEGGASYNAAAGTVCVMVNPPVGVAAVTNAYAFESGWDAENDESLRKRILQAYRLPPTGVSPSSMAESVLALDEILDCNVTKYVGNTVNVYVKTKSGTLPQALSDAVKNKLGISQVAKLNVSVQLATCREYDLTVYVTTAGEAPEETEAKIKSAVREYTDAVKMGESVYLNKIFYAVSYRVPVQSCEIQCSEAANNVISGTANSYLKLRELTVICDE